MAWLSVGSSNDDLCDKLLQHSVLREDSNILSAFRRTDRGDFVPPEDRLQAYHDRPYKRGEVHISAPHMYVTVLEALDLRPGMSFLNVGSGSGYLSALAAILLGEGGLSHGIEVSERMVQHSTEAVKQWFEKNISIHAAGGPTLRMKDNVHEEFQVSLDSIKFVSGNCFDIDLANTVSTCRYDRIYVGAGCPDSRKDFFLSMLNEDGVLVVPINEKNQMVRVRRFCGSVFNQTHVSNVHFAPLIETSVRPDEMEHIYIAHQIQLREQRSRSSSLAIDPVSDTSNSTVFNSHQYVSASQAADEEEANNDDDSLLAFGILSAESSSSFIIHPAPNNISRSRRCDILRYGEGSRVCLPPLIWAPNRNRNKQFPKEFRRALFTVLLVNNRASQQSNVLAVRKNCLPHQMWIYIFSFMNRQWFAKPKTEVELLSAELLVERRMRANAEEKLKTAQRLCRAAERERDLFRAVMMRLSERNDSEEHARESSIASTIINFISSSRGPSNLLNSFGMGLETLLQMHPLHDFEEHDEDVEEEEAEVEEEDEDWDDDEEINSADDMEIEMEEPAVNSLFVTRNVEVHDDEQSPVVEFVSTASDQNVAQMSVAGDADHVSMDSPHAANSDELENYNPLIQTSFNNIEVDAVTERSSLSAEQTGVSSEGEQELETSKNPFNDSSTSQVSCSLGSEGSNTTMESTLSVSRGLHTTKHIDDSPVMTINLGPPQKSESRKRNFDDAEEELQTDELT